MTYTGYELLWLFFVYSFLGWILETVAAAFKQKRFINRGLVSLPFCVLYGIAAVFITVFGSDLHGIWLYLGAALLATLFEWTAGHLIERLYHERWWDYSNIRLNLDGYICLPVSLFWGALSMVMMAWGNAFFMQVFHLIPGLLRMILIWGLSALLAVDIAATLIALHAKENHFQYWNRISRCLSGFTSRFAQGIYRRIDRRIQKAYAGGKKQEPAEEPRPGVFAYGCSFHKLVWLFFIGALLGDITETVFCRITAGVWMSRSSVVWGPFSIVWGLAIVAATLLLHRYRDRSDGTIFWVGTLLGGVYEYVCSIFTELVFGKVFWDYSNIPFNLGGRINLLYCFFWGIAAVIWIKHLYPRLSRLIERVPRTPGRIISWIMIVFMCCNMAVSCMALIRSEQRAENIPATQSWQQVMDERFDDERLNRIYPNALDADTL